MFVPFPSYLFVVPCAYKTCFQWLYIIVCYFYVLNPLRSYDALKMQVERQTTGRSLGLEEALWLCRCLEDSVTITWVRYDMIWQSLTQTWLCFFCWQLWQLHVSSVRHMRSPVWRQAKQLSRVLLTTLQSEWPEWPCGPCTPDISDIAIRVQVGEPQSRWTWIVMILLIYFILLHLFFVLINDFYILMYICGILWQMRTGNWWKSRFKV